MRLAALTSLAAAVLLIPACTTTTGRGSGGDAATPRSDSPRRDHPLGSGSVEFVGFDQRELDEDLRVIPEEGRSLFAPAADMRIENVDGFWWRGSKQWFKIPDHCHTTITKTAAGMQAASDCSGLGTRLQGLRGSLTESAWVDDSGTTRHTTDFPF